MDEHKNHSIIEVSLYFKESAELMANFVEDILKTPKSKQRLVLQANEEETGAVGILSYKFDNQVREVGRFLSENVLVLPTAIIIKNYVRERFITYLNLNGVEYNELIV